MDNIFSERIIQVQERVSKSGVDANLVAKDMSEAEAHFGSSGIPISVEDTCAVYIQPGTDIRSGNSITIRGRRSVVYVAEGVSLRHCKISIAASDCVVIIGPNCRFSGVVIEVKGNGGAFAIGAGSTWESGAAISHAGKMIAIGDDAMFSNGVVLRTSDGHGIWTKGGAEQISLPKDVLIHSHVWLGNGVRVNKGSNVDTGTVVGQMSVVSGYLEGNSIYGGIPARKIREDVEWSRTNNYSDIPDKFRSGPKFSIIDDIRFPSGFDLKSVPVPAASLDDVIDRTESAFEQGRPFSLVRCGDGESIVMGFPKFVHKVRYMKWMKDFFGDHANGAEKFSGLSVDLREAIKIADIVGGYSEVFQYPLEAEKISLALGSVSNLTNDQKKEISHIEWRLLWESVKDVISSDALYTNTSIHIRLEERGVIKRIIEKSKDITLITGNDILSRFETAFPGRRVQALKVPTEFKWSNNASSWINEPPHFPDVYEDILSVIKHGNFSGVVLIGAGPCGKVYASEVKKAGGFAIDVGSLMDVWASRETRSYMKKIKEVTFEN